MTTYTIIASSITLPGEMSLWTFDSREKAGAFILSKGYEKHHWHVIHLSIYETQMNGSEPAKLSLRSIEDFYKHDIKEAVILSSMDRLRTALATNIHAQNDNLTLKQVTANTWKDAQHSWEASEAAKVLADYAEYANYTITELKQKFSDLGLGQTESRTTS